MSGKKGLNPSLGNVVLSSKSETVHSHGNSFVVNAHSVAGLTQKKGVIPSFVRITQK